jgi:hypothetical protein
MFPPFDANLDGVIAGQSDLTTRGFLFTRTQQIVNVDGAVVPLGTPGSKAVQTPGFARYDFTAGSNLGSVTAPLEVPARWPGLIPLLDAGPAIDTALRWCDAALTAYLWVRPVRRRRPQPLIVYSQPIYADLPHTYGPPKMTENHGVPGSNPGPAT